MEPEEHLDTKYHLFSTQYWLWDKILQHREWTESLIWEEECRGYIDTLEVWSPEVGLSDRVSIYDESSMLAQYVSDECSLVIDLSPQGMTHWSDIMLGRNSMYFLTHDILCMIWEYISSLWLLSEYTEERHEHRWWIPLHTYREYLRLYLTHRREPFEVVEKQSEREACIIERSVFSLYVEIVFLREEEEIQALSILWKYLREFEGVEYYMSWEIDTMALEHRSIEEHIVPDDDRITDKYSNTLPYIFPYLSTLEHLFRDTSDEDDLVRERDSWTDEHGSFFLISYLPTHPISLESKSDRRDLYDRIMCRIESCRLEIKGDEGVSWRIQNAKLKIQSV